MKLKLLAGGALVLLIASGWVYAWFRPPSEQTLFRALPVVYKAPDWKADLPKAPLAECPQIETVVPTPKQREKIEKQLHTILPPGDLLALKEVAPAPYGAKILVSLPPKNADGTPRPVEVLVSPNARPFIEWLAAREISVGYGMSGDLQRAFGAEYRQDIVRVGPAILGVRAGAINIGSETTTYGLLSASVRF